MKVRVVRGEAPSPGLDEAADTLRAEGLSSPRQWGNAPGDQYGWHEHAYRKVLCCVSGSIIFHTEEGDHELSAGDRLEIEPGTRHAATVGPEGVQCVEASG